MKRNKFSLSNYRLQTMPLGHLVPIGFHNVMPGDTFQQSTTALVRTLPLMAPVMHPVEVKIHHWFVPFRLLWQIGEMDAENNNIRPNGWEAFITGQERTKFPRTLLNSEIEKGSLHDYLGIPPGDYTSGGVGGTSISALPFRAYALIWNEYYRDQDLQKSIPIDQTSGGLSGFDSTPKALMPVNWEKDYFTTSRPWPQKGPQVMIPLETNPSGGPTKVLERGTSNIVGPEALQADGAGNLIGATSGQVYLDDNGNYYIDPNEIREGMAVQRLEEARARYGSRYTEYLRYLGVRSSDARLQRPEYLGGGKHRIQFSEVLQTAQDANDEGVGNLKGHGISATRSNRYRRFFEEDGIVMSFMIVRPQPMYTQGVQRFWFKNTVEEFFQKELAHLGQQEVFNREIFFTGGDNADQSTFGYQDMYDEYRHAFNSIAGDMRDTFNFWHMARDFGVQPVLNADFVECNATDRIYQVTDPRPLQVYIHHSIQARRPIPKVPRPHVY